MKGYVTVIWHKHLFIITNTSQHWHDILFSLCHSDIFSGKHLRAHVLIILLQGNWDIVHVLANSKVIECSFSLGDYPPTD